MERKLPEKNFLVGYRFSSFLEILENAVPFATGSCRKFKPDVLVEWKVPIDFSNLCVNAIIFTIYALSPFGENIIRANSLRK